MTWTLSEEGVLTISGTGAMDSFSTNYVNSIHNTTAPWGTSATSVVINKGVTSIGSSAFAGCTRLTSITIPDSLTSIGFYSFMDCIGLTSITIPESVTSIEGWAFGNCSNLDIVYLPANVMLGSGVLANTNQVKVYIEPNSITAKEYSKQGSFCVEGKNYRLQYLYENNEIIGLSFAGLIDKTVTSQNIPEDVTNISAHAFKDCSGLISIIIPEGVTSIGTAAFYGCSSLTSITIPDSVTSIDSLVFFGCTNLTSIIIPEGVTNIGESAFYGCRSLTSIIIPEGVTGIGESAFYACISLTSIIIPEGVTSIGASAFYACSSLNSIMVPDSVVTFSSLYSSFLGYYGMIICNLESPVAYYLGTMEQCFRTPGANHSLRYLYDNNSVVGLELTSLDQDVETFVIPAGVISIGNSAFSGCGSLTSITIPDRVTSIGSSAFSGCRSLTSITIPDSVVTFGSSGNSFEGYYGIIICNLESPVAYYLGSKEQHFRTPGANYSLCYIYDNNVVSGLELTSLDQDIETFVIPAGVTIIGMSAFDGCTNLTSVTIPDSVTGIGSYAFYNCTNLTSITIPDSVTSIGGWAFQGCTSLTSIILPDGITNIDSYTFYGCSGLTSITIPNGITSIGSYTFYGCSSLTSITIPDGVTCIGSYAFYGCRNLTSITIPDSVTSIDNHAFDYSGTYFCNMGSFASHYFSQQDEYGNYIYGGFHPIGSNYSVAYIYNENEISGIALLFVADVESFVIPDYITVLGNDMLFSTFGPSLKSIVIPNNVIQIGNEVFQNCSNLTSVIIPDSVIRIGRNAFSGCTSLVSVKIPNSITKIEWGTFNDCISLTSITIPNSITSIDSCAFAGCTNLVSLTIPDGVISIGDSVFNGCDSLSKLLIPESVITFGSSIVSSNPTIYCYSFTDADYWATNEGLQVVYLDSANTSSIREINMELPYRIACGDTMQIPYNVFPANDNPTITWTSSMPNVVSVADGVLTALANGTTTITATCDEATVSATVTVYTAAIDFSLSTEEIWLLARDSYQFSVIKLVPGDAEVTPTWTVSDTDYGSIDSSGLLTTIKPGDITVMCISERGIQRECLVHLCYPVTAIDLTTPYNKLITGNDVQLTANVTMRTQSCVNHLVSFTSSDETVATVDAEAGLVHGIVPGTVIITATSASNKAASIEIAVMDECDVHTPVIDEAVSATCTATGLTEGSHCIVCGAMIVAQEVVPAQGHDWSVAEYVWAEDLSTVTARRVCLNDESHAETEMVSVTAEIILQPTCLDMGETTYTSSAFENEAFEIQSRTETDIEALGHEWGAATYTWNVENSKVTATCICANDAEHVETETVNTTSEITKAATCEAKGETTYTSAAFENTAFTAQTKILDDVPALGHEWGAATYTWNADNSEVAAIRICAYDAEHVEAETVSAISEITKDATCEANGETTYTSAAFENTAFIAQTKTVDDVPALGHEWGEPTYTWNADNSKVTATRVCAHDAEHVELETVSTTSESTKAATCETKGETTYISAAFENTAFTIQTKTVDDVLALGHEWSEPIYTWSDDNNTVTASRICLHDPNHMETETAACFRELKTPPTETGGGDYWIISEPFENTAFEVQIQMAWAIPTLNEMTVLKLPAYLKTIETEAFEGIAAQAVIIPQGCTTIEPKAFINCTNLLYVRVPAGIVIPDNAFAGCPNVVIDQR